MPFLCKFYLITRKDHLTGNGLNLKGNNYSALAGLTEGPDRVSLQTLKQSRNDAFHKAQRFRTNLLLYWLMSACSPVQMGEIPSLKFISPVDLLNKLFSLSSFIFSIPHFQGRCFFLKPHGMSMHSTHSYRCIICWHECGFFKTFFLLCFGFGLGFFLTTVKAKSQNQ